MRNVFRLHSFHDACEQRLESIRIYMFSAADVKMCSPAGRRDAVMLSDRRIRSCYSVLRQRQTKVVWWCDSDPVCVQQWPCVWLTPSLKQRHRKADMTCVTAAIITGQVSWPLPVAEHVAIRHNVAHRLAVESRSKKLFHNAAYCIRLYGFVFPLLQIAWCVFS